MVVSIDRAHGRSHFTTYGLLAEDKVEAAALGDTIRQGVGVNASDVVWFEDFRRQAKGVDLIAAERRRQVEQEGWTAEHDDHHVGGEIAGAAACYALASGVLTEEGLADYRPRLWPWAEDWWKPKDPLRNLVRAGALIAAEIDRLLRARKD